MLLITRTKNGTTKERVESILVFHADCIQSQVFKEAATYLQLNVDQFVIVSQNGFSDRYLKTM